MHDTNFFLSAFLYLATAVLMVPVAHRLGLGSVLGYLIGGAVIGPFALGWVGGSQGEEAMHFAEFGVVIMLFIIGLELEPSRLWRMRGPIFGLGGLQVALATLAAIALCLGFAWILAQVTGLGVGTLILGTSPGGIAEMAITAKVLQLGVPLVTAFQVFRLVAVLLLVEPLYRWRYGRAA